MRNNNKKAFTLVEAMMALSILAFVSSSVFVVISRCMDSTANSQMRMQAFEVARENMEMLLVSDSVEEKVEYGSSEMYPLIQWQTIIESFYEPITEQMWIQAVCSAQYLDTEGLEQTVDLTHWLTNLTKQQMDELKQDEDQLLETIEEAAVYAGVDEQTINEWVNNGMLLSKEDYYIKDWLDLYATTDGNPSDQAREQLVLDTASLLKSEDIADVVGDIDPTDPGPTPE